MLAEVGFGGAACVKLPPVWPLTGFGPFLGVSLEGACSCGQRIPGWALVKSLKIEEACGFSGLMQTAGRSPCWTAKFVNDLGRHRGFPDVNDRESIGPPSPVGPWGRAARTAKATAPHHDW